MPIATVQQIKAWSFSRYQTYVKCPQMAAFKFIQRLAEPGNEAMDRGTAIHKLAEDFTKGLLKKLPEELKAFKAEFLALKMSGAIVEENWGFTRQWEPIAWDNWALCWLRIKMDACYLNDDNWLVVIDHKTGKQNEDHKEQLSLYAVTGMIMFPDCKGVKAKLWYLDQGIEDGADYPRSQMKSLVAEWEKKVKAMLSDKKFAPRTSRHCGWCFYSRNPNKTNKGVPGPCKF